MYENIFEYQKYDMEIYKIKNKLEASNYKKLVSSMVKKNKEIQDNKNKMEVEAKKLLAELSDCQNALEQGKKEIESLQKSFKNKEINAEELDEKSKKLSTRLNTISKKFIILQKNFENMNKAFADLKKDAIAVKTNYKNAKDAQEKLEQSQKSVLDKLEKEKAKMQEGIDKKILAEYEKLKQDNIMPVYVRIYNNDCCGGCMQKLSTSALAKGDNRLVCEMCRRIIIRE